ncbi:MAG TPA: hypothetical protein VFE48_12200 [Methylomirabilota bacterium]|nr:hypothetical protein [Methylomirabilota bacterium]
MARLFLLCALVLTLASCASSSGPARPARSEFEDVPVPAGLTLDSHRTTIIESPTVKAARLVYRSRIKPDSLAVAYRTALEANGWRHVSSTTSADKGITQVYEKQDSSLQVLIYEGWYYTWTEVSTTRITGRPTAAPGSR